MVGRRTWTGIAAGILLLAGPSSVRADDAAVFAPGMAGDLIIHGTEVERAWGHHVLEQLPADARASAQEWIQATKERGKVAKAPRPFGLPNVRVALRLRYLLASRDLLRDLGVNLRGLDRDSPPYPSEDERRAGSPMREARPDVDVLERLHDAIEDGRIRTLGSSESEDDVGTLQALSVLAPGGEDRPSTGAVLHVCPYFTGPPRLGSLAIRRIVATRKAQADASELEMLGSAHVLDPSWGLHVAVRDGEVLLLSPRWAVGRAWTGDALPLLELTVRVLPLPAPGVIDLSEARRQGEPYVRRQLATLEDVRDEGSRVGFDIDKTDRLFFGERLVVTRGPDRGKYVTIVEVVGIRGTRIEARSVPVFEKYRIEAGDHVVGFMPRRD